MLLDCIPDLQPGDRMQMALSGYEYYDSLRVLTGMFSRIDALGIWWIPDADEPTEDFAFWGDILDVVRTE